MKKFIRVLLFLVLILPTLYIITTEVKQKSPSGFVVLDQSLLASYSFEDNFFDLTDKTTTENFGSSFSEGKKGRAIQLDGSNDYVSFSKNFIEDNKDLTISIWIYPEESTDQYQIVFWEGAAEANGFGPQPEAHLSVDYKVQKVEFWASSFFDSLRLSGSIKEKEWSHIVVSLKDMDTDEAFTRLYIDGNLSDEKEMNYSLIRNYTKPLRVGRPGTSNHKFSGKLDELRIYSSVLTDGQIRDLFEEGVECRKDIQCQGSNSTNYCIESFQCINTTTATCISPGKNSRCEISSKVLCNPCEFGCLNGNCVENENKVNEEIPPAVETLPEEKKISFFGKTKCRIFHFFSKEKREACLIKD